MTRRFLFPFLALFVWLVASIASADVPPPTDAGRDAGGGGGGGGCAVAPVAPSAVPVALLFAGLIVLRRRR